MDPISTFIKNKYTVPPLTVAEEMSENISEEEAETDREVGETKEVVKRGPERATMG